MGIDWNTLLGFLIALFSFGNVVVYGLCIMKSKNWRRIMWGVVAAGSLLLCLGFVALIFGFLPADLIDFLIRPGLFLIICILFAFGLWELVRGRHER